MAESYLDRARAAARLLTGWFTTDLVDTWVPNQDYWKAPTIAQELVAHMALAGPTPAYTSLVEYVRESGIDYLASSSYLDDATVWGRFHITAYDWLTATGGQGAESFLDDATTVYGGLTSTWDDQCGGGLYWMRPNPWDPDSNNFKAMNATLGLMEIGLGLHRITGDAGQLEWAQRAWTWIQGTGLIDADGMVWGG